MRLRRTYVFAPVLAALMVISGLFTSGLAQPASASHGARITIHKAVCPSYVWDVFGECHDDRLAGVPFYVAGVWRSTDWNGVVSWTPGQGTHTIWEDWDVFSSYNGAYVYCRNQVTNQVLWNGLATSSGNVTITTTAGQEVICDWYNLT